MFNGYHESTDKVHLMGLFLRRELVHTGYHIYLFLELSNC